MRSYVHMINDTLGRAGYVGRVQGWKNPFSIKLVGINYSKNISM
jgi:hypothetical protein